MVGTELSAIDEASERQRDVFSVREVPVPTAQELQIGPLQEATDQPRATDVRSPQVEEPAVDPAFLRERRVLAGVINSAAESQRDVASDNVRKEPKPQDAPPAPTTGTGSGGDKPPIDRTPRDGAADMPDEPQDHSKALSRRPEVLEGDIVGRSTSYEVEVQHREGYDVLVNRGHPDSELVEYAVERLHDGVPNSWHHIGERHDSSHYVDSREKPRLWAMVRHLDDAPAPVNEQKADQTDGNAPSDLGGQMTAVAKIGEVLANDPGVQQALREEGVTSLDVPPPVAVVNDREMWHEITVYPWQNGVPALDPAGDEIAPSGDALSLVGNVLSEVARALEQNDISYADINTQQFLIENTSEGVRLSLVEAEMFQTLEPEEYAPVRYAPRLVRGGVEHCTNDQWYELNGAQQQASDDPRIAQCQPDSIVVGRQGMDIDQSPILQSELQGGSAVATWNDRTGEGGVVHFGSEAMHDVDAQFQTINELFASVPALGMPNVRAWVIGDEVSTPRPESEWFGSGEIRAILQDLGIEDPQVVSIAGSHSVKLHVSHGVIEVFDEAGRRLFPDSTSNTGE